MKKNSPHHGLPAARIPFEHWYHSAAFGHILQRIEASYLSRSLQLTFSHRILQVGQLGTELLYFPESYRRNVTLVTENHTPSLGLPVVQARHSALPIDNSSVNLVIVPHVYEFVSRPNDFLNEITRVTMSGGRVIFLSLNPICLYAYRSVAPGLNSFSRWTTRSITPSGMIDRLANWNFSATLTAGFDILSGSVIDNPATFWRISKTYISLAYAIEAVKLDHRRPQVRASNRARLGSELRDWAIQPAGAGRTIVPFGGVSE